MTINRRRGPPRAAASATMNESAQGSILQASRQVNQSQMSNVTTASRRGFLDQSKKKIIWDFIVEILEDVQRGNISVKDAYKNFIELYYQEKSEEVCLDVTLSVRMNIYCGHCINCRVLFVTFHLLFGLLIIIGLVLKKVRTCFSSLLTGRNTLRRACGE